MRAALELILEAGVPEIAAAVDALAQQIEEGVRDRGYERPGSPHSRHRLGNRKFPAPFDGQRRDRKRSKGAEDIGDAAAGVGSSLATLLHHCGRNR